MNKHISGAVLITLSMVIFSWIGPFVRTIQLPPLMIIFYSSMITSLLLMGFFVRMRWLGRVVPKEHIGWLVASAVLVLGNVFCYFRAYELTTLANTVLTHYTAPIFAALCAPLLLNEKIERVTVAALFISMTGLLLIAANGLSFSSADFAGIMYGTASGLFYGLAIVVTKKVVEKFHIAVILFWQCVITVLVVAPFVPFIDHNITFNTLLLLILYALTASLLGVLLYMKGLRYVEAQHAGVLAYAEPLLVVMIGMVLYDEMLMMSSAVGGLLIVFSGCLILRAEAGREPLL
ncbi:MAG: DMT family transporter [Deltaproteobacteria bacterium]|nr:DMT family transporter [Deltaproteobacteria bacterium]